MIDLSKCEDFGLGSVTIRPSSREIVGDGGATTVEPKVMQMLVVLARAAGRVVSRDDLIAQCWGERVVGEDAINRVIGKLRRAAEGAAAGAFRIETVPRIGLRLHPAGGSEPVAPATAIAPASVVIAAAAPRARWPLAAAVLAAAAALGLVVARALPPAAPATPATEPRLPAAVADLETRGLSAMFENAPEQTAEGVAYLRQATALAPRSAPVWGSLAMSYVLSLGWVPPSERAAVAARTRDAAAHAHAIDPKEPRAAAALVSLQPTFGHWDAKQRALRDSTARSRPDHGPLQYQTVQWLIATGRTGEALARIGPLAKASPLIPWIQAANIDLLATAGRLAEADRAAAAALAIWPRDPLIWFASFDLAAFGGQPARALAMAGDRAGWPRQTATEDIELAVRTVRAMISRDAGETAAVIAAYRTRSRLGQAHAERAMRAAAALKQPADALAFAHALYAGGLQAEPRATMLPHIGLASDAELPTAALFLTPAQGLWSDREFFVLLSRLGLVGHWRRTGPPDACRLAGAAPLCREFGIAGAPGGPAT